MWQPRLRASPPCSKAPVRRSTRSSPPSMHRGRTARASLPFSRRTRTPKTAKAVWRIASARFRRAPRGFLRRPDLRRIAGWLLLVALYGSLAHAAEDSQIAKRRAAERRTFTDVEIFKGFFLTAFGA